MRVDEIRRHLFLGSHNSVLDIGGGTGWVAYCLANLVNKWVIVDYSAASLKVAAHCLEHFPNVRLMQSDIMDYAVDFQPDRVLAAGSLQYLESMEAIEQLLRRLFDAIDRSSICLFTQNPWIDKREEILKEADEGAVEIIKHHLWFSPQDLSALCVKIGFRLVDCFSIDPRNWQTGYMFNMRVIK